MKNINIILTYLLLVALLSCNKEPTIHNPSKYINRIDSIRTTAINTDSEFTENFDKYDFYATSDTILYDSIFDSATTKYNNLLIELRRLETQAYSEDDDYRKSTLELVEHLIKIKNELFNKILRTSSNKNKDSLTQMIVRYQKKLDELYLISNNEKIKLNIKYGLYTGVNYPKVQPFESNKIIDRLKSKNYLNKKLSEFCYDFKDVIEDTLWTTEPPAKLFGVILPVGNRRYFRIRLEDVPDSLIFNIDNSWKFEDVGGSKIAGMKLSQNDSILIEFDIDGHVW